VWEDFPRLTAIAAGYAAEWVAAAKASGSRVRYWEIGNEECGLRDTLMPVERYAQLVREFARQMRAADPGIVILATGGDAAWNRRLLELAGDSFDMLTFHPYCHACTEDLDPWWKEYFPAPVLSAAEYRTIAYDRLLVAYDIALQRQRRWLEKNLVRPLRGTGKGLAFTEYNIAGNDPLMYGQGQALVIATQLLQFAEQGADIAVYWAAYAWHWELTALDPPIGHFPAGEAFKLLSGNLRGRLYSVEVNSPRLAYKSLGAGAPALRAWAFADAQKAGLVLINWNPWRPAEITIQAPAFLADGTCHVSVLWNDRLSIRAPQDRAEKWQHAIMRDKRRATRLEGKHLEHLQLSVVNGCVVLKLPPAGIAVLTGRPAHQGSPAAS